MFRMPTVKTEKVSTLLKSKQYDYSDFKYELIFHLRTYKSIASLPPLEAHLVKVYPTYKQLIETCIDQRAIEIERAYGGNRRANYTQTVRVRRKVS